MTVQKCCLTLGWDTIGWDNISPDVQILGIDLSPVGEIVECDVKQPFSLTHSLTNITTEHVISVFKARLPPRSSYVIFNILSK